METSSQDDTVNTYRVWEQFSNRFATVFPENLSNLSFTDRKQCSAILDEIFKTWHQHCKHLIPADRHSETSLKLYTSFHSWLFGQFVRIFLCEYYENRTNDSQEAQLALLLYIASENPYIFNSLIQLYLKFLQYLCDVAFQENAANDSDFCWFQSPGHMPIVLDKVTFRVQNSEIVEPVDLLLKIFRSLASSICDMCAASLHLLWRCCVKLVANNDINRSLCYQILVILVEQDDLPDHEDEFNPTLSELLLHVMNDIGKLCQNGKLREEDDFCSLLNILSEYLRSDTCYDDSYINYIHCLIFQCQVPLKESTENALLRYYSKLLRLSPNETSIMNMSTESNLQPISISLLAITLKNSLEKQFEQTLNISNLEVYQTNKNWRCLIDQTNSYIQDVERKPNSVSDTQLVALFKAVRNVTHDAMHISHRFNVNFTFFGGEIYSIIGGLARIMETCKNTKIMYQLLIAIVRDVLMLPETEHVDINNKTHLLALLTLPLRSFQFSTHLPATLHDRLWDLVDDEIKVDCITSLMHVRQLASDHKYLLFDESFAMPGRKVFEAFPVLIHHLTDDELRYFLEYLVNADPRRLTELSPFIEKIVCALDGHCILTKLSSGEDIELCCRICDSKNLSDSVIPVVSESRRQYINSLISSITLASDEGKLNVLKGAVRISNHVCESNYQDFLKLLHGFFTSERAEIREKIVQITPYILFKNIIDSTTPVEYSGTTLNHDQFASYVKSLQEVLVTALYNCDAATQYACIKSIGKIGDIPIEMTLYPCVNLLITAMMLAPSKSSRLAKSTMEQIARTHGRDEEIIYLKYRDNLFPLVTHLIVVNLTSYETNLCDLRFDYSTVFSSATLPHILKYLLPEIVVWEYAQCIMEELAEICDISVKKMLLNGAPCIFSHVMLSKEPDQAVKVFELMELKTGVKISDMLKSFVAKVTADLLIHYEDQRDKVTRCILAFRKLLSSDSLQSIRSSASANKDRVIAQFVKVRFFGILMRLEAQLRSESIPSRTRRLIISSLKYIIELMDPDYVTKVRFKLLFTLRTITASEKDEYPVLCVHLWDTFIKLIDKEVLGPILSTIFVSLIPLADKERNRVHNLLRSLVVENGTVVQPHLNDLYFVTPDQCDEETFQAIQTAQKFDEMSLEEKLKLLTKFSQHEIVEVKLHALKRLKNELSKHHVEISQLILASDSVSYLVLEIHRVLLEGFRNPDPNIQEAIGVCLGEFGAIDPSYIPNTAMKVDDAKKYTCCRIDETQFVVDTLKVLCRGYQTAENNSVMDTFALAIQTTLKSYEVKDSNECTYWSHIPDKLREIIHPFFTTTYILISNDSESTDNIPHLIYSLEGCTSVLKWANGWSNFLISLLPRDTREMQIFQHFKGVISNDNECMLFFLPYILLKAVSSASDANLMKIYDEMISIISDDRRLGLQASSEENSSTQLVVSEELSVMRNVVEQSMEVICAKTVFHCLDVLNKKFRDMRLACKGNPTPECRKLEKFLSKFSPAEMAEKSFKRKEYTRSLLYMEENLFRNQKNLDSMDKYLATMAKTFVYLNDVDNVKGLFARHSIKLRQPQHVILLHEITDQFQDAAICYEQLLKNSNEKCSQVYETRMIRGYLSMNQPEMALRLVENPSAAVLRKHSSEMYDDLKCEALWNLSQYDDLERVTSTERARQNDAWGVRIGQSVVHFLKNRPGLLDEELARIRKTLAKSLHLTSAGYGGYKECYDVAIKLHILNEFEKVSDLVFKTLSTSKPISECRISFESLFKTEFEERLNKLQPVSRVLQPVLNIRQTLFSVARRLSGEKPELVAMFNEEIRKCWLKVVEIANRTRNFQLAYSNILAIDNYQLKGFFIEKAKYYWEKMEQREALRTLEDGIAFHYPDYEEMARLKSIENTEDRIICAEAMLLIGTYNDTMVNTDLDTNLQYFRKAHQLYPESEKILVKLAQYLDKITSSIPLEERYRSKDSFCVEMVRYYGNSLEYGCEFIYQSLSRMINVWLDYATALYQDKAQRIPIDERRQAWTDLTVLINKFIGRIPTYYFCTAFSLIMSRLSHTVDVCFNKLSQIIVKCLKAYPNQMLWQFMSLHGSKNATLRKRFQSIINAEQLNQMTPIIMKFQQVFEQFSKLCSASRVGNMACGATSLKTLLRRQSLPLLTQFDNDIMIPAQKFLNIVLPRSSASLEKTSSYNPFPETMVYISRIKDEVLIYSSLQKPIRVTFVGTDGKDYVMIFKAYDDMRIDCRVVEFNSVVNMYLKRDVEARDRALRIRTYTVLPLLDSTGVIEFIPGLVSMRTINTQIRRSFGMSNIATKTYECALHDSFEKKREVFQTLVQLHPPFLHEWFRQEFPNPTSWYTARTSYIRSLAVMSMVGYTLGLGDRHNDNILLDANSGDVIHVDLNVIFNFGENLTWPERVPFRLTHSMIKAMGLLGYDGSFQCTCEIVNRILRERKEQLISILHMFLYDPPDPRREQKPEYNPQNSIKKVESRLNGCVTAYKQPPSIPLSVEGQTRKLIEEATSEHNLCQMFIGWSAFI
ncbi:serine/threonine-protein kinase ATR-like [Planococcus citri]|uniref:serine/threonine-protein kinase ATR-like n=1 Tax=Planococcus citri TaxID=170843 RepID=UPI0031F8C2BC